MDVPTRQEITRNTEKKQDFLGKVPVDRRLPEETPNRLATTGAQMDYAPWPLRKPAHYKVNHAWPAQIQSLVSGRETTSAVGAVLSGLKVDMTQVRESVESLETVAKEEIQIAIKTEESTMTKANDTQRAIADVRFDVKGALSCTVGAKSSVGAQAQEITGIQKEMKDVSTKIDQLMKTLASEQTVVPDEAIPPAPQVQRSGGNDRIDPFPSASPFEQSQPWIDLVIDSHGITVPDPGDAKPLVFQPAANRLSGRMSAS